MGAEKFLREQREAWETIPVVPHPLYREDEAFTDLYVKCVLILLKNDPSAFADPAEGAKQFRLFARSMRIGPERQRRLEAEAAECDGMFETEMLIKLAYGDSGEVPTCILRDWVRLHGARYVIRGAFASGWRDMACHFARLSGERLAAAEKFCRNIAAGRKLAAPEKYASVPAAFVSYFGQKAFAAAGGKTGGA